MNNSICYINITINGHSWKEKIDIKVSFAGNYIEKVNNDL